MKECRGQSEREVLTREYDVPRCFRVTDLLAQRGLGEELTLVAVNLHHVLGYTRGFEQQIERQIENAGRWAG